jgi:hypothetical protein
VPPVDNEKQLKIPGVLDWVVKATRSDEMSDDWEIRREMEHWNDARYGGPHKSIDEMERLVALAKVPSRANSTMRVVSALLVDAVAEFFNIDQLEHMIKSGHSLPRKPPWQEVKPMFQCPKCQTRVHTLYESKRHACGWGKTKRKRTSL